MLINDYDLCFIDSFEKSDDIKDKEYDLFISAYNKEIMVLDVFKKVNAKKKIWLVFPDYNDLDLSEYSQGEYFSIDGSNIDYNTNESAFINSFLEKYSMNTETDKRICIDVTGFIKPYMIFLILALEYLQYKNIDILYSEPKSYNNNEDTDFSINETKIVRTIDWNSKRILSYENDLLFINVGYDNKLVDNVVNFYKGIGKHRILLGFPSLQPIMYQENILNLVKTAENLHIDHTFNPIFSSANDPFDTAKVINNELVQYIEKNKNVQNILLAPLATKAQALGIIYFYIKEYNKFAEKGVTLHIVYPFTKSYSATSSNDLAKINRYTLEF